jgi:hypothetical protein
VGALDVSALAPLGPALIYVQGAARPQPRASPVRFHRDFPCRINVFLLEFFLVECRRQSPCHPADAHENRSIVNLRLLKKVVTQARRFVK